MNTESMSFDRGVEGNIAELGVPYLHLGFHLLVELHVRSCVPDFC
jgi:hypothetical protein